MKTIALASLGLAALLMGSTAASAKTLVYCSEGSPENFQPAINTTGTSFDASLPIYNRLTEFKRGATQVVPGLAESWEVADGGKTITFHLRKGVKFHSVRDFKPSRDFNADDVLVLLRPAVEARPPLRQGLGRQVRLFQRHGHALAARFDREDRRLHRRLQAEDAERRHPRQSGDGLRLDRLGRIRRLPDARRERRSSSIRFPSARGRSPSSPTRRIP